MSMYDFLKTHKTSDFLRGVAEINRQLGYKDCADGLENVAVTVEKETMMDDRKLYIGGSDIAAVMGVSRWESPLQLWAVKTGKLEPEDLSGKEYVELGTELEDFVAHKFERKTGMKVRRAPKRYIHKDYNFCRCQVDRLLEGTDELLECKTCSAWKAKEWGGEEIPLEYILQVMWQLGITGRSIGHIAVLIGGQAFKHKKIEFDQELFEKMVKAAVEFMEFVKKDTPPMAVGADNYFISELYPANDEQIQDIEELNDSVGLLQETKMHIDELKKQQDELEAKIKQRIGENLGFKTSKYFVSWKSQIRNHLDNAKLKVDGLYEKYLKQSASRVLRVRLNKEESHADSPRSKTSSH